MIRFAVFTRLARLLDIEDKPTQNKLGAIVKKYDSANL